VKDWNFQKGKDFEAGIHKRFGSLVQHPSSSPQGAFPLLTVFCQFTFCLTESLVSLALHAILGGTPVGFHVTIWVGDFACEHNPSSNPSFGHAQDSNLKKPADAIPIKVLFDGLKG
jgi:hypothetical protein